jgi:hypothetical protein
MDLICCGISQRQWEFLAGENWLSALGNGFHALASHTAGSHSFFSCCGPYLGAENAILHIGFCNVAADGLRLSFRACLDSLSFL